MESSLRHTVVTGRFTLVATLVACALICLLTGYDFGRDWAGLLYVCVAVLVFYIPYNSLSIIRTPTQLLPSLFLLYVTGVVVTGGFDRSFIAPLMFLPAQYCLFRTYQNMHSERYLFHAYLFLGLGALFAVEFSVFLLLYFIVLLVRLQSFSLRAVAAAIVGLLVAAEFIAGYDLLTGREEILVSHFTVPEDLRWENALHLDTMRLVDLGVWLLVFLPAFACYRRKVFYDKIHIRICYSILCVFVIASLVLYAVCPQHREAIYLLLVVESVPYLVYYFVYGEGRLANMCFSLFVLYLLVSPVLRIWMR